MITHAGPHRGLVLAVYVALVVVALLVLGGRVLVSGDASTPSGVQESTSPGEG